MSESSDMDAPVTRRELHEALELWGGAITAQLTAIIREMLEASEQRTKATIAATEQSLLAELKHQTRGNTEDWSAKLTTVDDQYKDLPARVTRLEAKVFAPKRRRNRSR
jgi:hypothetical protein